MAISNQSEKKISLKQKLIVTSVSSALGLAMAPLTWGAEASLEEVIVTARQRAESSQDVPMTIDTVSGEDIQKQGITTLQDFSRFVSGLNVTTTAAGQNTIVFRGVSDGGGFLVDPTAAIYLDEQAMSMTSMAPDIYPVDIARIEALSGPQSTLFGASSQTGTIRVITNKPDASGDEVSGNIGIGTASPTDTLQVNGDLQVTESIVFDAEDEIASAATITINWNNGNKQFVSLANDNNTIQFNKFTSDKVANVSLTIIQNGGNMDVSTWAGVEANVDIKWPGGSAPDLSDGDNDIDVINCLYHVNGHNGNGEFLCTPSFDFME